MGVDVLISNDAAKALARAPPQVKAKYTLWLSVMTVSGPPGLRRIRGFGDEALKGEWKGYRASRLSEQWRIIYRVEQQIAYVERVTPHDYRK